MTNDLDDLKAMMNDATPRPDATRRAENLALAQKNFGDLQGSRQQPRPTPVTGPKGLWTGVKTMLNTMTSKAALGTTTALVACGFLFLPQMQDVLRGPSTPPQITMTEFEGVTTAPQINSQPVVMGEQTDAGSIAEPTTPDVLQTPQALPEELNQTGLTAPPPPPVQIAENDQSDSFAAELAEPAPAPVIPAEAAEQEESAPISSLRPQARGNLTEKAAEPDFQWQGSVTPNADVILDNGLTAGAYFDIVEPTPGASAQSATRTTDSLLEDQAFRAVPDGVEREDTIASPQPNTEAFPISDTNPLQITSETPVSTFSIDVDTAAYSVVRSSLSRGQLPPAQAVRIEELINYFPYDYAAPDTGEAPFRPTVSTFQTPWNPNTQLVHIALQGQMPALDDRPPLNLVFLIDTSGSMNDPVKLPLLKQSFRLMLGQLRPTDEVAIVEYAGSAGQVLAPTAASERTTILNAIQSLGAGGSTNGQGGLEQAYTVAEAMKSDGEVNRIILATDGDFNVGLSSPDALKDFIADKRDTGTYLSVLGFGRGNLDDATMQALAQNGNGTAAYIDTLSEAQKVLVDQLSGALFPIAGDVKVQVEFNPAQVAEYRLIGYETRALAREDFNNDAVDAGELGAGHSVTAIYEITPVGSPAQLSDPLRYGESTVAATSDEIGFVKLRYKEPGADVSQLIETPIVGQSIPGTEANFAAAIAGFGQLLRNPQYLGDWGYDEAITLANGNRGSDPFGYRTEAVQLMRLAQSLSR
jgi:Ca-activated chloride channel family protein